MQIRTEQEGGRWETCRQGQMQEEVCVCVRVCTCTCTHAHTERNMRANEHTRAHTHERTHTHARTHSMEISSCTLTPTHRGEVYMESESLPGLDIKRNSHTPNRGNNILGWNYSTCKNHGRLEVPSLLYAEPSSFHRHYLIWSSSVP